jgi:hypothetical protein
MTREIKNARDLNTGELIYFAGHAQATFMSDGRTVEEAISSTVGGVVSETDPVFTASPAATITTNHISNWNNKVDKVSGKQLSTEDFTTALKNKLNSLTNYDDTDINDAIETLQTQINTLVSGNASNAIESFNEIIAFLNGIEDSQSLDSIVASIEQQIAAKQDKITDLDTIRSGASKGATAVQPGNLSTVATSGDYNDLTNKPAALPADGGNADTVGGFTVGVSVPADAKFTDTIYTLPNATSSVLGGVKVGTNIQVSSGTISVKNASTSAKGVVQLNNTLTSTSTSYAATANMVKKLNDEKQPKLVSGTNIKTINGESILGEGDIVIEGGSSSPANVQAVDTQETIDDVYDDNVVKYTAQSLTDEQKAQVRQNIGLANIINSVKLNGTTYTPTNGLVDLGNVSGGSSGGSASGYPIEEYLFDSVDELSVNANTYYIIEFFDNLVPPSLLIGLNDFEENVAKEYVFEIHNGAVASIVFDADIEWMQGPPVLSSYITLISICRGKGLWVNDENN